MENLPKRKSLRIGDFDYSTAGAYFITLCTQNRETIFWNLRRGDLWSPAENQSLPLSHAGLMAEAEIQRLTTIYPAIRVDNYCIMPDHVHLILTVHPDDDGRAQLAPTISRVVQQFKGAVTKKIGRPIWQKSYFDHVIRGQRDYEEIWRYIEENPLKYLSTGG